MKKIKNEDAALAKAMMIGRKIKLLNQKEQIAWFKKYMGILKTDGNLREEIKQMKKEELENEERKLSRFK